MLKEQEINTKTLYGKDSKGGFKVWSVKAEGSQVLVSHGKLDGKIQTKVTQCVGKNIGRANETTPEEQAIIEAAAKYKKQIDKLYRPTIEELEGIGGLLPMLAHDYTKVGHRMPYPCLVSPKLDGVRAIAQHKGSTAVMTSRGGKGYEVPYHLHVELMMLFEETGLSLFDGEIYKHGMALQDIVSAVKKTNEDTESLEYWIFDVPSDKPWKDREGDISDVFQAIEKLKLTHIKIVLNAIAEKEEEAREAMNFYLERGFEGLMLRDPSAPYVFNHRSAGLMKWKDFYDLEAKVIEVTRDKLDEGVLQCQMPNGNLFECKMRGKHVYREYGSMKTLIGSWITVRYQQFTNDGIPQFPVGVGVRECDENGWPQV